MQLEYWTGKAPELKEKLVRHAQTTLTSGTNAYILLVPDQLTLQTELDLLNAIDGAGSFRLQVLSPARLCARVFQQAGAPKQARVDEQGRVMLMQLAAVALRKELHWYHDAIERVGFAERAVRQIDQFKESFLSPDAVEEMAARETDPSAQKKLTDIAKIYRAYERAIAGRFMDGEDERQRAIARMADASFLRGADVLVYGFDLISPSLMRLILALTRYARAVTVTLALQNDLHARDVMIYESARKSLERLDQAARAQDIPTRRVCVPDRPIDARSARAHLARELFAVAPRAFSGKVTDAQAATLSSIAEEAAFAAALSRRLARQKGWRYRDIMLACPALNEEYINALRRAFALYKVPLFLAAGRPADRHPLAQALLSALRLITRGCATEDMCAYLRTGFATLTDDEADRLLNYALAHGVRGKRWQKPFSRGTDAECAEAEPLRSRAIAPIMELDRTMRSDASTKEKLAGLFGFLERIDAPRALEDARKTLTEMGYTQSAAEGAQVWNRIVAALDQLADFLPDTGVSARDVLSLLSRALGASVVKPLPQSSDAVEGASVAHITPRTVKALILMGMSAETAPETVGLLDHREMRRLSEKHNVFLGLTREEQGRVGKARMKALLALPEEYLVVTRPINDSKGDAVEAGRIMGDIERILPGLCARGGILGDEGIERMLLESAEAAPLRLGRLEKKDAPLAREAALALRALPETPEALLRVENARAFRIESEPIDGTETRKTYGALAAVSASRLEPYARCPFQHFVRYALRPEPFEEWALTPIDKGNFLHAALDGFVRENRFALGKMTREESELAMDRVSQTLAETLARQKARDSAVRAAQVETLRGVARYAAATIARQMRESLFAPLDPEREIEALVPVGDGRYLAGRIDRVDLWENAGKKYVRVVDYKLNDRVLTLSDIYNGLELQLMLYLAAAMREANALPAGAFYFGVRDPIIATDARDKDAIENARSRAVRMDGLAVDDMEILRAMAAAPEQAIRLQMGANGAYSLSGKVVTVAQLEGCVRYALGCARDSLARILQGDTRIAPVRSAGRLACEFCEHQVACQFDERVPGGTVREMPAIAAADALQRMQSE